MIKNQKQAALTKSKIQELTKSLSEFESQESVMHPIKFKLGINSFNGLIKDLQNQLKEYENLINENLNEFCNLKVPDFAKFLISARLAKNMSQKELAEKIGIQEQQIQRYEQDNYFKASWNRLMEAYVALDLNITLETFSLTKEKEAKIIQLLPKNISKENVDKAKLSVIQSKSLFYSEA